MTVQRIVCFRQQEESQEDYSVDVVVLFVTVEDTAPSGQVQFQPFHGIVPKEVEDLLFTMKISPSI